MAAQTTAGKFDFVTRKTVAMVTAIIAFTIYGIAEYSTSVGESFLIAGLMGFTCLVLCLADWAYNTDD